MFLILSPSKANFELNCKDYNIPNWNCEKYHFHFSPSKLENTLNCIGYKKYQYPSTNLTLKRKIKKLIDVQENSGLVRIFEFTDMGLFEDTLKFELCKKSKLQFSSPYSELFWQPDFDTSHETLFKINFDRITIYQVICKNFVHTIF